MKPRGIVYLWGLEQSVSPQEHATTTSGHLLHLVQAFAKGRLQTRLWLVTRGAQAVLAQNGQNSAASGLGASALWGLGKVIALEHPELSSVCLDLEPSEQANGILDNLHLAPISRPSVGSDEVEIEIEVHATGLNFRDVLNALGMLKAYYAEHLGIDNAAEVPFGFECAGTIVAVGRDVAKGHDISPFKVGDEVIASMVSGSLATFATVKANYVTHKPQQLSSSEAATIPLTFLTAYYGLHELAKIQPYDRVLIHAAAGGVGQAAVQLAQRAGAEVFATASTGKWDFLTRTGLDASHVMNSRTLDFADQIMALTNGKGVEIVLNSLNGAFVDKSFEVLAKGGRFVEIGKRGIWDEEKAQAVRPDAAYFPFDLGEVSQKQPHLVPSMFAQLMDAFKEGSLNPLPLKTFPVTEVVSAFRYMAQAKHIGKVVISLPANFNPPSDTLGEGGRGVRAG